VRWGDLDYLLIDMPPGTSDIQMGLARMLPRTEMLIVTTPAIGAQKVAARAADMARKGYLRVAGVIENMSSFTCDHGETYALFGEGGGQRLAEDVGVPLLASLPLDPHGEALHAAIAELAARIATEVIPPIEMQDCTARLFESVDAALGPKPS
jgi:ATP-binding protein involved in chromosome partitioning